ncbi:hypothetical protein F4604DRAFT_466118 [Suillus subluteus]|nr:hypothetical protein F4604DRAFT_466118 [Suillus subluteus]
MHDHDDSPLLCQSYARPNTKHVSGQYPMTTTTMAYAKVAVICTAIEQGVMEFIRFRGEPPPGYTTPYSLQDLRPWIVSEI